MFVATQYVFWLIIQDLTVWLVFSQPAAVERELCGVSLSQTTDSWMCIQTHAHTHAPPHICENRHTKLPAPQMKDTHKKMKADKCSRAKVTNWPTRESHLHFKKLHCLLADSSPSKTCFLAFLKHSANRSELADVPSLMSQHVYLQLMQPTAPMLSRNSTYKHR